jgi:integrase
MARRQGSFGTSRGPRACASPSKHGPAGEPAPVHPHMLRHARVRQIVRATRSLPLAQRQAGWVRLQMAYLTLGDDEARRMMRQVTE